jgi:hypothetical protein
MTKTYHCDVENCDKHYTRTNALNRHKALFHGIGTPNKDRKLRKHKCRECDKLKRHIKTHDEDLQKSFLFLFLFFLLFSFLHYC